MSYWPRKRNQKHRIKADGTQGADYTSGYENANCWAAVEAEGVDFATEGKIDWDPPTVRTKSGKPPRERAGYINPDLYAAAKAAGLHDLRVEPTYRGAGFRSPSSISWETFQKRLRRWTDSVWQISSDYDQVPDDLSCLPTFDGNHAFLVFGGTVRVEKAGKYQGQETAVVSDPLCNRRKRYPLDVIRKAGQKAGRHEDPPLPQGFLYATQYRQALPPLPPTPEPDPPPVTDPSQDEPVPVPTVPEPTPEELKARIAGLEEQLRTAQLTLGDYESRLARVREAAGVAALTLDTGPNTGETFNA